MTHTKETIQAALRHIDTMLDEIDMTIPQLGVDRQGRTEIQEAIHALWAVVEKETDKAHKYRTAA